MDRQTTEEIISCLEGTRTVLPYYRDRYSIGLLRQLSRSRRNVPLRVAALKQSRYAPLLQKPRVKTALARLGNQPLDDLFLAAHDHDPDQEHFVLTLGTWGSEQRAKYRVQQTSRPGLNLVLQLNLSRQHDGHYRKLGCPLSQFNYRGHPVSTQRNTLAWARIDLDWETGSALIEEIQSDWVRRIDWLAGRVDRRLAGGHAPEAPLNFWGLQCALKTARAYCAHVLERYASIWAEATLWATLQFIRDELGIHHVFYHSEPGGRLLKGIRHSAPPRSLYTDLPRRFCLMPTEDAPEFLWRDPDARSILRKHPGLSFFRFDPMLMGSANESSD